MKFKYQRATIFLLLLSILCHEKINAQQAPSSFTLPECVDYALKNNLKIHQATAAQSQAEYRIKEVKSQLYPQLNGTGSVDRNLVLRTAILPGELIGEPGTKIPVEMGAKNVLDFSARLEQVIYDPSIVEGLKIARTQRELEQLRKSLTEEETIYNVSYVFYELLGSNEELKELGTMLSRQESIHEMVQEKVEKGISRQVDLNRIQVNINNLRLRIKRLENVAYQQTNYLKTLMTMPAEEQLDIKYDTCTLMGTLDPLVSSPENNHTELDLLVKEKELVARQITQEEKRYLPTLSALLVGGYQFQSDQLRLSQDPWFRSVAVGARLNVPIFQGFARRHRIHQLHYRSQHLEFQRNDLQQNIEFKKLNSINQWQSSMASILEQKRNLSLAEDNYDKTNLLYQEGLIEISDVFDTESTLLQTKIAYHKEVVAYKKAQIELLKASGRLKPLSNHE